MNDEQLQQATAWFPYGLTGYVIYNIGLALMLRKAGLPWWGAIIPLYNFYLTVKLAGWSGIAVIWFVIPIANIVAFLLLCAALSRNFGHGFLVALGLFLFFPFLILVLGIDRSRFVGPITGLERA